MSIQGLSRKQILDYQIESDKAFRKMAKQIGNERHVYFETVNEGAYSLIKKRDVI